MNSIFKKIKYSFIKKPIIFIETGETELDYIPMNEYHQELNMRKQKLRESKIVSKPISNGVRQNTN
jgi:hypothetical protein